MSENISRTAEGYLLCRNVPIARTGYYRYAKSEGLRDVYGKALESDADGWISVYKSPEVLFSKATIDSFNNKPVTIGHTMIDPSNWAAKSVGIGTNIRRGTGALSNNLLADLLITDKSAIELVEKGDTRQISLGYNATYIAEGAGHAAQTSISGNHIAIVPAGKAGAACRIYDSMEAVLEWEKRMSLKDKIAACFKDEEHVEEQQGEVSAQQGEAPAPTADAFPPAPQQAAPAPAPQQGGAAAEINAKLDAILALLQQLAPKQQQAPAPAPQQQRYSIAPNAGN